MLAESDEIAAQICSWGVWYVPRSGFIHEWQRYALQGRRTRRQDKLSIDALGELTLHACLIASVA